MKIYQNGYPGNHFVQKNYLIYLTISLEINQRIIKFSELAPQSNVFLEELFINLKQSMILKDQSLREMKLENGEVNYWKETGLIECNSFSDYLLSIN